MRELEKIFKALSDEIRLRMLNLFFHIEKLYPCEIMSLLEVSQTRVSRNINLLLDAGFLKQKRKGKYISYYLNNELDNGLKNFISKKLESFEQIKIDLKNLESLKKDNFNVECKDDKYK